ncbi:DUF1616 domain-containing protein [Methanoregula sp.]|uniref:DUF1616 domain-containing protein n=1 Tax=Methanoregula sp. TaxID=2052170 RepID=UPI003C77C719
MERMQHPYETIIDAFARMSIPRDLLACELWLAGAIFTIYLPYLDASFLRVLFGIPLILFIPGYAIIAALFPAAKDIDGIERIALSFGLSIAVVPLTGLVLNYTPWGIRLDPIVTCLSILTVALCIAAQYRRARLLPEERFSVPFREMYHAVSGEFFSKPGSSRTDRVLSAILLIAIIAAVATTVYVVVVPKEGEKFTEFFILGENQKAADYPTDLVTGVNSSLFIGIGNHEYRTVNYTVETYFTNMSVDESTNTTTLDRMDLIDRFTVSVPDNQTVIQPYSFTPATTSFNRIDLLLFNETVPDDQVQGMDRINLSYRDLHLWVRVRRSP